MIHTLRPIGQVFLAESRLIGTQILQFALRPAYLRQVVNNPRPLWIVGIWFLVAQVISMTLKFGFALMGIAGSSLVVAGIPKLLVVVAVLALIGRENFIRSFTALLMALIPVAIIMGAVPIGILPSPAIWTIQAGLIAVYALAALPRLRLPGHPAAAYGVLTLGIVVLWRVVPLVGRFGH